jgi:hypothetical protein
MKRVICAAAIAALLPAYAAAQTAQELVDGSKDTGNVVNYGMGYNLNRFSTQQTNSQKFAPSVGLLARGYPVTGIPAAGLQGNALRLD